MSVEDSVRTEDLRGRMRIIAHNHPYFYQEDPLGKYPSGRDFYDDDADVMFFIARRGLFRYKMPEYIRDPQTGELFNPRLGTYKAFRDRIFGEDGPPYTGPLAREAVKDAMAFYRRLGMSVQDSPWGRAVFP